MHPTLGILARFQAFFLRLIIFPVGRRPAARPSAGNANRWATQKIVELTFTDIYQFTKSKKVAYAKISKKTKGKAEK